MRCAATLLTDTPGFALCSPAQRLAVGSRSACSVVPAEVLGTRAGVGSDLSRRALECQGCHEECGGKKRDEGVAERGRKGGRERKVRARCSGWEKGNEWLRCVFLFPLQTL